jgi:hypothetical protein
VPSVSCLLVFRRSAPSNQNFIIERAFVIDGLKTTGGQLSSILDHAFR